MPKNCAIAIANNSLDSLAQDIYFKIPFFLLIFASIHFKQFEASECQKFHKKHQKFFISIFKYVKVQVKR